MYATIAPRITLRPTSINLRGSLALALGALVFVLGAVSHPTTRWPFVLIAVVEVVLAVRFAAMRVVVQPDAVTVHGLFRTQRLPWTDIARIEAANRSPITLVTTSGRRIPCAAGESGQALAVLENAWRLAAPVARDTVRAPVDPPQPPAAAHDPFVRRSKITLRRPVVIAVLVPWVAIAFVAVVGSVLNAVSDTVGAIVGLPSLLVCLTAIVRLIGLRVVVRPDTVVIHNLFRNHRLRWADVAEVLEPSGERIVHGPGVVTRSGVRVRCAAYSIGKRWPKLEARWMAVLNGAWHQATAAGIPASKAAARAR